MDIFINWFLNFEIILNLQKSFKPNRKIFYSLNHYPVQVLQTRTFSYMNTDTSLPSNLPLLHVLSVVLITPLIMKGSVQSHTWHLSLWSPSVWSNFSVFHGLSWPLWFWKLWASYFVASLLGGRGECHRNDAVLFLCTLTGGSRIQFVPLVKMSTLTTQSTDYGSVLQFSPL